MYVEYPFACSVYFLAMDAITRRAGEASKRALIALRGPLGAKFRLSDIDVEEVSLVDRPANRHRFLVVKRAGAAADDSGTGDEMLTEAMRTNLLKSMIDGLETLTGVMDLVRDAEVGKPLPNDTTLHALGRELAHVEKTVAGVLERYPALKEDEMPSNLGSEAADKLKVIGALIMEVAEAGDPGRVAEIAAAALSITAEKCDESVAKLMKGVGEAVTALAAKSEGAEKLDGKASLQLRDLANDLLQFAGEIAKDETPPADPPADPPKPADPPADPPKPAAKTEDPPADPPADPPKPADPPADPSADPPAAVDKTEDRLSAMEATLAEFKEMLTGISKKLTAPARAPDPDPEPPKDESETLAKVTKSLADLRATVEKMADAPAPPASRTDDGDDRRSNAHKNDRRPATVGQFGVW